jgi:hypothetical protein
VEALLGRCKDAKRSATPSSENTMSDVMVKGPSGARSATTGRATVILIEPSVPELRLNTFWLRSNIPLSGARDLGAEP